MTDAVIRADQVQNAPAGYKVPGAQEIVVKSVRAVVDGSAAASAFVAVLQLIDPAGNVVWQSPTSASIAAGGSADVSWFPGLGGGGGGGGGGGPQVTLLFGAPDATNGYVALVKTTNVRLLVPAFTAGVDSQWWGILDVPTDYASGGTIELWVAANDNTGHVSRWLVATNPESTSATWDAALTAETAQNVTMPTTAYRPVAVSFTLTTAPVAGNSMAFYVERNGANAADTLTADAVLFKARFTYFT